MSFSLRRPIAWPPRWPTGLPLAFLIGGLAAGCLPELETQCAVDDDCPAERPICVAEVCAPSGTPIDAAPDGLVVDRGLDDAAPVDVGADVAVEDGDASPCPNRAPEICNGLDDDCDGVTDEVAGGEPLGRPCYTADPMTQGRGVCRAGRASCVDGAYGECEGEVVPRDEVCADDLCEGLCNGLDDDCDGTADEGLVRPCGPEAEIGLCRRGTEACTEGFWQACEGAVPPANDICDGQDNDCDLSVDEGDGDCLCAEGESQPCYSGADGTLDVGVCADGIQDCTEAGTFGACLDEITPLPERCDGADNDCDGVVDEDVGGRPCSVGAGACARDGQTVCDADARQELCDAEPGAPVEELCNDLDDDCDGGVDEGFRLGQACSRGVGGCEVIGSRICRGGQGVCDAMAGDPGVEVCNGIDDDCDGTVDEGDGGAPLERSCYDQPGGNPGVGACREGVQACEDGAWGACVGDQRPLAERCNQIDDDCNGEVDDVPGGCACSVGQMQQCYGAEPQTQDVGVCRGGSQTCMEVAGGGTAFGPCVGEVLPDDEACNGADDDCDGVTDEGAFGPCSAGVGACAAAGVRLCVDGAPMCDAQAGAPDVEACNGVDDDCNGVVDDIAAERCTVGQGACVNDGFLRCGDGAPECDAAPGAPSPEVCNGVDDDCDGALDEDVPSVACERGQGACRRAGDTVCVGGAIECAAVPGEPADEACNGDDDDCDGLVDEQPGDLCPVGPNATGLCAAGMCGLTCDMGFFDGDDLAENGCERGCGARIAGQAIEADGRPIAVAARPDVDEFAIAWLTADGTPWMSIEGGAPFEIGGQAARTGADLQLVGVRGGYSALLYNAAGSFAVDVPVDAGQPGAITVWGGVAGLPGAVLLVRRPEAIGTPDGVPVLQEGVALGGVDGAQFTVASRVFGADFGASAQLAGAGTGWISGSLSSTTVGNRTLLVGVGSDERVGREIRGFFLEDVAPTVAPMPARIGGTLRTAVAARGANIVVAVSGDAAAGAVSVQAGGDFAAALDIQGTGRVIGVQYGPFGPVISGLANNDVVSVGVETSADGLVPLFGPQAIIAFGQPGSGAIPEADVTLTAGDRRVVVWRDRRDHVRWGINPCR